MFGESVRNAPGGADVVGSIHADDERGAPHVQSAELDVQEAIVSCSSIEHLVTFTIFLFQ